MKLGWSPHSIKRTGFQSACQNYYSAFVCLQLFSFDGFCLSFYLYIRAFGSVFFFSSAALHCFLVLADCVEYKALVILMFKSEWLPVDHEGHRFTNNSKKDQIKWKVIWDETSLKSWSIFPTLNSWEIHLLYSVLIRGEQKQHDIPVRAGNRWRLGDLSQDAADITEKNSRTVYSVWSDYNNFRVFL